ncbi:hypothetical protein BC833DRAFT_606742, partial [Globomyces pollinis-pini]
MANVWILLVSAIVLIIRRVVVFMWNLVPALMISFIFAYYGGSKSKIDLAFMKYYFSIDPRFNGLIFLQIFLTALYFTMGYLQTRTVIFGNDRASLFAAHLRTVLIGFHELLAIFILQQLNTFSMQVQKCQAFDISNNQSKAVAAEKSNL